MPNLVKVGHSGRSAWHRASELSRPTGVPTAFEVFYERLVESPARVEAEVHARLRHMHAGGEFFRTEAAEAVRVVEEVCAALSVPSDATHPPVELTAVEPPTFAPEEEGWATELQETRTRKKRKVPDISVRFAGLLLALGVIGVAYAAVESLGPLWARLGIDPNGWIPALAMIGLLIGGLVAVAAVGLRLEDKEKTLREVGRDGNVS